MAKPAFKMSNLCIAKQDSSHAVISFSHFLPRLDLLPAKVCKIQNPKSKIQNPKSKNLMGFALKTMNSVFKMMDCVLKMKFVFLFFAKERLLYKELGRVSCSGGLERQLRRLGSDVHVFGHTHINHDKTLNGVRYVQHPLKYPDERQHCERFDFLPISTPRLLHSGPLWLHFAPFYSKIPFNFQGFRSGGKCWESHGWHRPYGSPTGRSTASDLITH